MIASNQCPYCYGLGDRHAHGCPFTFTNVGDIDAARPSREVQKPPHEVQKILDGLRERAARGFPAEPRIPISIGVEEEGKEKLKVELKGDVWSSVFIVSKEALPQVINLAKETEATVVLPMNDELEIENITALVRAARALGKAKVVLVLVRDL